MNKFTRMTRLVVLVMALLLAVPLARVTSAGEDKPTVLVTDRQTTVVYKPSLRGDPQARVDGGTRGTGGKATVLQVLAPDHTGLTTQAQPTVYWYARTPAAARFEFALIDNESNEPLLEVEEDSDRVAGFRHLNLGDYGITLQPGVSYQWSVALVSGEASRSSDLLSSGIIERIEPEEALLSRIENVAGIDLVGVYAREGFWYDALDNISRLIEQTSANQNLVAIRDSLLAQVGLPAVTGR